jgi:hypothetical protein
VTRPHAADDFAMIRARIEELRRERTPPRAAEDFAAIRARIEGVTSATKYWPQPARFGDPPEARSVKTRPSMRAGSSSRS